MLHILALQLFTTRSTKVLLYYGAKTKTNKNVGHKTEDLWSMVPKRSDRRGNGLIDMGKKTNETKKIIVFLTCKSLVVVFCLQKKCF